MKCLHAALRPGPTFTMPRTKASEMAKAKALKKAKEREPVDPEDGQYIVKKVLRKRGDKYLLRWRGYTKAQDCWVHKDDIDPKLLAKFARSK